MDNVVLISIPLKELQTLIGDTVENKLKEVLVSSKTSQAENDEYATRSEVAKKLRISLPTLCQYTKDGLLKGYRVGRRVLYKHNEVDSVLTEITTSKYKRKDHIK